MADSNPLQIVNTFLLAGVLLTTTMVTCSNDRLEGKVQDLSASFERNVDGGSGGGDLAALADELKAAIASSATARAAVPAAERIAGEESPYSAVGWGGRRAKILFVEGAEADAPIRRSDKPKPQGDAYVKRRSSPPSSLNFYATNEGETATITSGILHTLIGLEPRTMAEEPWLATSWDVSDDKLTYTYHLRRGVQFADGRPFTSADVKFSFDTMRDNAVKAEHLRPDFEDVISLEAADAYTVIVKYRKKYWKGVYTVGYSLRVLNKGWYEEQIPKTAREQGIKQYSITPGKPGFGEVFNKIRLPCPGTGPYFLRENGTFDKDGVRLNANPFFWMTQIYPLRYNMKYSQTVFITDEVAAFEEFRKQKIDMAGVEMDDWDENLSKDPTVTGISKNFEYTFWKNHASYIAWNCRQAPFDDARVRLAMTHLVDRQWILDELQRGRGQIASCNAMLETPSYNTDFEPWPFDIERAKVLLAEAGWKDTDGDGVLDREGVRFEFALKVPSGRQFYVRLGGALQDACKKVGIRMQTKPVEWATFINDYYARAFDAVCLYASWPDPWPDNYEFHSSQDFPKGGNTPGWHNDDADKLLTDMRLEFDDEKRKDMFLEFNRIFHAEQPKTLLMHGKVVVLVNNRFEDIEVLKANGLAAVYAWVKPENVRHK